jgi:hypothetical protein
VNTNTPVAAFALLNDPVYVEAAQALARRMAETSNATLAVRASSGFRHVLARSPTDQEVSRLVELFNKQRERFAVDSTAARAMATDPLGPAPEGAKLEELAAWTVVANVILNLDEALCN